MLLKILIFFICSTFKLIWSRILKPPFICHFYYPLITKVWFFLVFQSKKNLVALCPRMHPTVLSSPLSKMRSVEHTSRSQPDLMVPVVTLEPVVLHCWWCQFLIWHTISPACWDRQWCTGLLRNIKLTLAIKHSHAFRIMGRCKCTAQKKKKGCILTNCFCF